jgi:hypothetical protein
MANAETAFHCIFHTCSHTCSRTDLLLIRTLLLRNMNWICMSVSTILVPDLRTRSVSSQLEPFAKYWPNSSPEYTMLPIPNPEIACHKLICRQAKR